MQDDAEMNQMDSFRFRLLAFAGHGANDLYWMILPVVLPLMLSQYQLRYSGGGSVISIYLLVVAVTSLFVGKLSDRVHRWKLIGAGFLLTAVGFAAGAASAPLPLFVAALMVAAVGVSVFHPTMYGAIDQAVKARRASFFGVFESWGGATLTVMFVVVGVLLRVVSWRIVLLLVAIPGLVAGIVFLLESRRTAGDPQPRNRPPEFAMASGPAKRPSGALLAVYLISNMLRFVAVTGILSFMPTYFVDVAGLDPDIAAFVGALFFGGGVLGARIGGYLGDRLQPYRVKLVALACVPPLVFLLGTLTSAVALATVVFLLGIAAMTCIPLQNSLIRDFGPQLGSGQIFGIMMAAMTTTQALSPALFGAVADRVGLASSIRLFALAAVLSFVLLLLLSRSRFARRDLAASAS